EVDTLPGEQVRYACEAHGTAVRCRLRGGKALRTKGGDLFSPQSSLFHDPNTGTPKDLQPLGSRGRRRDRHRAPPGRLPDPRVPLPERDRDATLTFPTSPKGAETIPETLRSRVTATQRAPNQRNR